MTVRPRAWLSRWWFGRPASALLPAVALVLAVIRIGAPLHLHHGTTAGFYNEEHVLAALDSVTGDAPLPAPEPTAPLDDGSDKAQPSRGVAPSAPVVGHADPRAPPPLA
jgi:hypothetical protein